MRRAFAFIAAPALVVAACASSTSPPAVDAGLSGNLPPAVSLFQESCAAHVGDFEGLRRYAASAGLTPIIGPEKAALPDGKVAPLRHEAWRAPGGIVNAETFPRFSGMSPIVICEVLARDLDPAATRRSLERVRVQGAALGPPDESSTVGPGFKNSGMRGLAWDGQWGGRVHYVFAPAAGDPRFDRLEISGPER